MPQYQRLAILTNITSAFLLAVQMQTEKKPLKVCSSQGNTFARVTKWVVPFNESQFTLFYVCMLHVLISAFSMSLPFIFSEGTSCQARHLKITTRTTFTSEQ